MNAEDLVDLVLEIQAHDEHLRDELLTDFLLVPYPTLATQDN